MKRIASIVMICLASCSSGNNVRRVNSQPTVAEITAVNMERYNVERLPEPTPLTMQTLLGNNASQNTGAQSIYIYTPNTPNPVRPYVLGPWNGVCFNGDAINNIVVSVNQAVRTIRNDEFLRLQTLSGHAQRDIAMLQADFRLIREGYQAQINERDIALTESQRTIESLRSRNVWTSVGIGVGGVLLGLGVSGLFTLFSR